MPKGSRQTEHRAGNFRLFPALRESLGIPSSPLCNFVNSHRLPAASLLSLSLSLPVVLSDAQIQVLSEYFAELRKWHRRVVRAMADRRSSTSSARSPPSSPNPLLLRPLFPQTSNPSSSQTQIRAPLEILVLALALAPPPLFNPSPKNPSWSSAHLPLRPRPLRLPSNRPAVWTLSAGG